MLAAADPALMGVVVAAVMVAGSVAVALISRADRARLDRLEGDVADCKEAVAECRKGDRRKKKALLRLGVDPDDPMFDDDDR